MGEEVCVPVAVPEGVGAARVSSVPSARATSSSAVGAVLLLPSPAAPDGETRIGDDSCCRPDALRRDVPMELLARATPPADKHRTVPSDAVT